MAKLKSDFFDFLYETLCEYGMQNAECMTKYELEKLRSIRYLFRDLHDEILERIDEK